MRAKMEHCEQLIQTDELLRLTISLTVFEHSALGSVIKNLIGLNPCVCKNKTDFCETTL